VVKSYTYGNGLVELNTFNFDGELDTLTVKNGTVNVINRTHQRTDGQNITGIIDNMTAGNSATFAAENAGKLQNADGPWGSRTFYYDGVGNRVTELATIGTVSTNDAYSYPVGSNRLVQITRGTSTRATMTYDVGGNLLTDMRLGLKKTYTYNQRNRMATMGDGTTSYAYTYNGREQLAIRQKTTAPVVTTHFVHDIFGNVIAETSGTAAGTKREYIWLPETEIAPTREAMAQVDRPLAVVDGVGTTGVVVWNVSVDHLNRPVLMTNSAKVTQWQAVWQPWGGAHSITGPAGTAANDYRLPGQWYQLESGLHYNWHRQYDPTIGRYTQPDPLGFVDGPSVYGYAGGKPTAGVDPDGRYLPWTHFDMTFISAWSVGFSFSESLKLARSSVMADFEPGSQSDAMAHSHAMRRPGEWPHQAKKRYEDYIEELVRSCKLRNLGFAAHAVQDSTSSPHDGFQENIKPWVTVEGTVHSAGHVIQDAIVHPLFTPVKYIKSIILTRELLKRCTCRTLRYL
jgi:RHS repeat-associated protein